MSKAEQELIWFDIVENVKHEVYVRIRVAGGWMVTHALSNQNGNSESSIFVPDSRNDWRNPTNDQE